MAYDLCELMKWDDKTEMRVKEGIEQNRKGDFVLHAKPGETVTVRLKNHKFRFGCNLFMLDEIPDDPKKNELYKEKLAALFNMATLPFYWDSTEPEEGHTRYTTDAERLYRRPPIDLCMQFCKEHGIEPREHALCYEHTFPKWLWDRPVGEIKQHLEKRMEEISSRYASRIRTIEVTNEMGWLKGRTAWYNDPDYMIDCYKMAEEYFPGNQLVINEWAGLWEGAGTPWDTYFSQIQNVLERGGRIDAVGMQYHMFYRAEEYLDKTRRYYDLPHLFRILDSYARFEKPIQITEITVPAYTEDPADEESQADVLEKLYSLWFSHPNVEQIVYWNLADGYAAFTTPGNMAEGENYYRGGLLRFDMSEKPAYRRLRHLIREVWTTHETLTADGSGAVRFRGFFGDYEVTAGGRTVGVSLDRNGEEITV